METIKKLYSIETYLPAFEWFYNTLDWLALDYRLWLCDEERELEAWEWKAAALQYAKDYCKHFDIEAREFCERHNVKIEFQELYSPEYYNYLNDSINIRLTSEFENEKDFVIAFDTWSKEFEKNKSLRFGDVMYYRLTWE